MIETLIISKSGDHPRKQFQLDQLDRLGLAGSVLDAVTPGDLDPLALQKLQMSWARPLLPTEVALTQSHLRAWSITVETGRPHMVLEDDAVLSKSTARLLGDLQHIDDIDLVSLETFMLEKLLGTQPTPLKHSDRTLRKLYRDRGGAAAYVVWPEGARKLIASVAQTCPPADAAIHLAPRMLRFQMVPAAAIQAYFLKSSDVMTSKNVAALGSSTIERQGKLAYPSRGIWMWCKWRRLGASWIILLRKLSALGRSEKLIVPFDPD